MPEPRHPQLDRHPHGGPAGDAAPVLDFSVNANPFGPNPVLAAAARTADLSAYPDPTMRDARVALARWHDLAPEEIVPAAGASELLHRLVRAYVLPGMRVLSVHAPFGEFERAARLEQAELHLAAPWDAEDAIRALRPALVYACRPHNPLGTAIPAVTVTALADACADTGAILVLDEAYANITPDLEPVAAHPALVRLHSPGKLHGLVGVRPAYAVAPRRIAAHLANLAPAWSVSAPTLAVLQALPEAQGFVRETLPEWYALARALKTDLSRTAPVYDSLLPFFTVDVGDAARVARSLLTMGVRVRDCASYGLPSRVRVSPRRAGDNERLVRALSEVLACRP